MQPLSPRNRTSRPPNQTPLPGNVRSMFARCSILHFLFVPSNLPISPLNSFTPNFIRLRSERPVFSLFVFSPIYMTEHQFAQFLGKCRLYQYLPVEQKKMLPQMLMTDTQIGIVAKSFYHDENFSTIEHGNEISMWNVYNLLTGANKSSYIDNFLDRAYNATQLAEGLNKALYGDCEYALGLFSNRMFQDLYVHYGGKFSALPYGRNYICHYQFGFRGSCALHLLLR